MARSKLCRRLAIGAAALVQPWLLSQTVGAQTGAVSRDSAPGRASAGLPSLAIEAPRLEAAVEVDGRLDESVWRSAQVLSGFTQYDPVEGRPAAERTEVLVFYTAEAIYVGVRAHDSQPNRIRATLADRDRILEDDHVAVLLDTFHDRRRAYAFYVNPLGVQQDGIWVEGGVEVRGRRQQVDFRPDFLWESRGRLTRSGYEVEIRVPFSSLAFQPSRRQDWGFNVLRKVQRTGYSDSWAPISRQNASVLAQSGTLVGLERLTWKRPVHLAPVLSARLEGGRGPTGSYQYGAVAPELGLDVRYGPLPNMALNVTVNPDFSQVEADAEQIAVNERFALFYPEKRPFFLEGADLFELPRRLVYTRTIAAPAVGFRLTGKLGRTHLAYLGALDREPFGSRLALAGPTDRRFFNIVRLRRDVGQHSAVSALYTDGSAGGDANRVAALDGRVRLGDLYTVTFLGTVSWTATPDTLARGSLLSAVVERQGRRLVARAEFDHVSPGFETVTGFVPRVDYTQGSFFARWYNYGKRGAVVQSWGPALYANGLSDYGGFWGLGSALEGSVGLRMFTEFRGGHAVNLSYSRSFFVLEPERYTVLVARRADGSTVPFRFAGDGALRGLNGVFLGWALSFKRFAGMGRFTWDEVPIFEEGSLGREWGASEWFLFRPNDALRLEFTVRHSSIFRARDGSRYSTATVPRLRLEYQLSRAIFLRLVGQYAAIRTDGLRDPATGLPLYRTGTEGVQAPAGPTERNDFTADVLFSYEPSPGTVVFLGYGQQLDDNGRFRFRSLTRRADVLFAKVSYLFRR